MLAVFFQALGRPIILREFFKTPVIQTNRRAWKEGSEPHFLAPLRMDPLDPVDPRMNAFLSVLGDFTIANHTYLALARCFFRLF